MADEGRRRCRNESGAPLEAEEVGKGSDGEIDHDVHSPSVYGVDELYPIIDGAPMGVEDGKVEGRIA